MFSLIRRLFQRQCFNSDPTDLDLDWLHPPADVHDVAAWDRYWEGHAAHGLGPARSDAMASDPDLVNLMMQLGLKTVLCAGNGLSQEPIALAALGFRVTALDLSPRAVMYTQNFDPDFLYQMHCSPGKVSEGGGEINFVTGNLLEAEVCPGPYDVVIERCTVQLFNKKERHLALNRLIARLGNPGLFVSQVHNGGWRPGRPLEHFAEP